MKKYFIDTSFLVAFSYDKDKYHEIALKTMKDIEEEKTSVLFTSDYVIDEFLNITMKLSGINQSIKWGQLLFPEEFIRILYTNKSIITSAWNIFQNEKNERKLMNLTDCIVYLSNQSLSCDELLTYDDRLKNYRNS